MIRILRFFRKTELRLLSVFIVLHVLISLIYIHYQDPTIDEQPYYGYTVRWAHGAMDRVYEWDDSKTPATFPAIIPRAIYQVFHPGYVTKDDGLYDLMMGRYLMCFYTIITSIYLFVWCRKLFGKKGWILPVLFFLFSPLTLGYSMLVLSDMATGACMIATFYHAWTFYNTRLQKQFILFSLWMGVSIVVKASFIFIIPCLCTLLLILMVAGHLDFNIKKLAFYSLLATLLIVFVLNLSYFGFDTFQPLAIFKFRSQQFQLLAEKLSFLKGWYVPVPRAIIEGWDLLQFHKELGPGKVGSTYGGVYVLGETYPQGAVWFYYMVVVAIKFPIAILLLLLAALTSGIIYFDPKQFFTSHIFYVFPMVFFLVVLSCFNTFQSGVRHLLLIYPLIFMAIGALICYWQKKWQKTNLVVFILFASMIASQLYYFPNLIPYTNEFLIDKKDAFRIIIDSNLDYGHYSRYANTFIKEHPEYKKAPLSPQTGKFILAIHDVFELRPADTKAYEWLFKLEPKAHYKFCYLLFEVSDRDLSGLSPTR